MKTRMMWAVVLVVLQASLGWGASPSKVLEIGKSPESVCRGFDGKLYVSMINGDEPGDGTIVKVDGDEVSVFATGFNAPKGLVYVGGFLVTADETTLWKIATDGTATKLAEAKAFPAPIEFLNDVAAGKDNASVYVSEMSSPQPMFDPSGERKLWPVDGDEAKQLPSKGCVYKVTLEGTVSVAIPAGTVPLRFPNGVAVGGTAADERLFVGDFFSGELLRYAQGKFQTVASGMRGIDGVTVTKDHFYASSWTEGKVWKVDRKTQASVVLLEGLKTAADFFHDAKERQLIIPDMVAGQLIFLPLE